MKNKTLLEAATDMLLNRPETTVSENISPSVLENLDFLSLHKILDKAFDVVGEKYSEAIDDDSDMEHGFRALSGDIDDLLDMIADNKDNLYSFGGINKLKTIPNIKENEALDLTGAVLEEISARCESIRESMKLISAIEKLCNGILRDSYTDFNSTVFNVFGESAKEEELEEGSEMDDIAAKVAELEVGDKTNFGVVVAKGSNSVIFKGKDLPKTKITFNQRKMGSRDYVLSALRKIN